MGWVIIGGLMTGLVYGQGSCGSISLKWVLPNPNEGKEKVAIQNITDAGLSLDNWQIDDVEGGSKPINLSGQIKAGKEKIIELRSAMFNNNGDAVRLICNGQVKEETKYPKADKGRYWVKDKNNNWCFRASVGQGSFECPIPTPTLTSSPTPLPTAFVHPKAACFKLLITKVYPAPLTGEKEKVKIFNPNPFKVDLDFYWLDDKEGQAAPLELKGEISEREEKEIVLSSGRFNNSGDQIRLGCGDQIIDGLKYDGSKKGFVLVKDKNGVLCWKPYNFWALGFNEMDCGMKSKSLPLIQIKKSPSKKKMWSKRQVIIVYGEKPVTNLRVDNNHRKKDEKENKERFEKLWIANWWVNLSGVSWLLWAARLKRLRVNE